MFDDPQTIVGALIGFAIVLIGTVLAVRGHILREREDSPDDLSRPDR